MSELLAFIDLGSNAVRCLLVRVTPGVGFEVLRQERVQTRLGGGRAGLLPPTAVKDTLATVRRFLREVRGASQPRVLAVATAAVRDATNRDDLLTTLKRDEGVEVRVLSGAEEAHLGTFAALQSLSFRNGVVVDLGGGSLQITHVRAGDISSTASVPLGAVRTTQRFFSSDPPKQQELLALREEIGKQISSILPSASEGQEIIGLGGTVRTLASMHLTTLGGPRPSRQGLHLQWSDITRMRERLEGLPIHNRRWVPGLKDERADIILAGAVVVEEVMALGSYKTLTVCKDGVRHGLLLHETFHGSA